jgi:hypothetical protein
MDSQTILILFVGIVALIVILITNKSNTTIIGPVPDNIMDPTAWEVGPNMNGTNPSVYPSLHPTPCPEGWLLDIPQPTADAGHVHYLRVPTAPLTGKTKMTLRFRLEMDAATKLVPVHFPGSPSLLTLYFDRKGDDWSATGGYEAYRWFASFRTQQDLKPGEYVVEARFDENWTAVLRSSRENNPEGFQAALNEAGHVGFVLGGGDGLGHGVYATGPARLVVTYFGVE